MTDSPFASPIGLSRDPHWDDAWTDKRTNQYVLPHPDNEFERLRAGRASELGKTVSNTFTLNRWHKEMVLRGVLIRRSILLRAANALNGSGLSAKGLKQSAGLMVNYLYDLSRIETCHDRFVHGRVVHSRALSALL